MSTPASRCQSWFRLAPELDGHRGRSTAFGSHRELVGGRSSPRCGGASSRSSRSVKGARRVDEPERRVSRRAVRGSRSSRHDRVEERGRVVAVDDAVVGRQRQRQRRRRRRPDHRRLRVRTDRTAAEDRDLRRTDDRRGEAPAFGAVVGDGERRAADLLGRETARAAAAVRRLISSPRRAKPHAARRARPARRARRSIATAIAHVHRAVEHDLVVGTSRDEFRIGIASIATTVPARTSAVSVIVVASGSRAARRARRATGARPSRRTARCAGPHATRRPCCGPSPAGSRAAARRRSPGRGRAAPRRARRRR